MNFKKSYQQILFILILSILLISFNSISYAKNNTITVYIESQKVDFEIDPILKDGRVLVPMRKIFEELGAKVTWDQKTKTVYSEKNNIKMNLTIGNKIANINGKNFSMDIAPVLYKGNTLVPLRIVSETYGLQTNWINNSKEVRIISNPIYIKNKNISLKIGMSIKDLKSVMGEPNRVDEGKINAKWYTYNNQPNKYKDFLLVKVRDNRVIGFQTNSKNWVLSDLIKVDNKFSKTKLFDSFSKKHISNGYDLDIYQYENLKTINGFSIIEKDMLEYSHLNNFANSRDEDFSKKELLGIQRQIFDMTNVYRINKNLKPLIWNNNINNFAKNHSIDMMEKNYFKHDSLTQSYRERVQSLLIKNQWKECGENIAFGYTDAISMVNGWYNSKDHRENLLNSKWKYHGVGIIPDKDNLLYGTQNFTY